MPRTSCLQHFRLLNYIACFALCAWALDVEQSADHIAAGTPVHFVNTAPPELLACYNANTSTDPSTFSQFIDAKPTRSLQLHRVWWSDWAAGFPLTVFTQIDLSRIRVLEQQCRSYRGGVISAAVWVPLVQPRGDPNLTPHNQEVLRNATRAVEGLFLKMEALNRATSQNNSSSSSQAPPQFAACSLRLLLMVEPVADEALSMLMPINALRNAAMLAADTPLAAMVDVDLSISQGLAARVMVNKTRTADLIRRSEQENAVWVMPAWDTNKTLGYHNRCAMVDEVIAMRPADKFTKLKAAWLERVDVFPFAFDRFPPGHNTTDYWRWIDAASDYQVTYAKGYEPWFITARKDIPLYDARFRGYYFNKLLNVRYNALCLKKRFWVLPEVWLVHRHHDVIVSSNVWYKTRVKKQEALSEVLDKPMFPNGTTVREVFYQTSHGWYQDTYGQTELRRYVPIADVASQHCRKVLPWWRW